jgi:hypothetical protein
LLGHNNLAKGQINHSSRLALTADWGIQAVDCFGSV